MAKWKEDNLLLKESVPMMKGESSLENSPFILNPETNRYDSEEDFNVTRDILKNFVAEDGDGFTINFGVIEGDFDCSELGLKSLKGAPIEVSGNFDCSWNKLTSLNGGPRLVFGNFSCVGNPLINLSRIPYEIGGDLNYSVNHLRNSSKEWLNKVSIGGKVRRSTVG